MPNSPLDRQSFAPLYYQLAEKLKILIDTTLAPGELVPSENELVERYNVSRNTVRKAIDELSKQGWVLRVQGKGTYVASERMRYGLHKLISFTEDMHRRGLQPRTKLLSFRTLAPLPKIQHELKILPGEEVYEIHRLRLADDEPMALNTTYIPCSLLPKLTAETVRSVSLFRTVENTLTARVGYAKRIVKPVNADPYLAELLSVPPNSPLMLIEGPTFLDNDQPFEYVSTYYRGDRYTFSIHSVR